MKWLPMASSGAHNTHMTGIESSIAIEELDESLIESIENFNDPQVEELLCQLTKEVKSTKLDSSKKDKEIETPKDDLQDLNSNVMNDERYLSKDSLKSTNPPIKQHGKKNNQNCNFSARTASG